MNIQSLNYMTIFKKILVLEVLKVRQKNDIKKLSKDTCTKTLKVRKNKEKEKQTKNIYKKDNTYKRRLINIDMCMYRYR